MNLFSNRSRWYNENNLKRSINSTFTTISTHNFYNNMYF